MALPAQDQFSGTNGQELTAYSSNWSINDGGFLINSNAFHPNETSGDCAARWTADSFANDQSSQIRVDAITLGHYVGVAVRCDTGGAVTYYAYYGTTNTRVLFKRVGGTYFQLGVASGFGFGVNDVVRLEVTGDTTVTLTPKINGVTDAQIGIVIDTAPLILSGAAGISGFNTSSLSRGDNWQADNIPPTPGQADDDDVGLQWDANTEPDLAGYRVYWGDAPGTYNAPTSPTDVGNQTTYTVQNLADGNWYFAVTAYDTSLNESGPSNEVSSVVSTVTPPGLPIFSIQTPTVHVVKHGSY